MVGPLWHGVEEIIPTLISVITLLAVKAKSYNTCPWSLQHSSAQDIGALVKITKKVHQNKNKRLP